MSLTHARFSSTVCVAVWETWAHPAVLVSQVHPVQTPSLSHGREGATLAVVAVFPKFEWRETLFPFHRLNGAIRPFSGLSCNLSVGRLSETSTPRSERLVRLPCWRLLRFSSATVSCCGRAAQALCTLSTRPPPKAAV